MSRQRNESESDDENMINKNISISKSKILVTGLVEMRRETMTTMMMTNHHSRRRHAAPAHPQQQNNGKRQRSKQDTTSTNTEVLMAMHIFQDEVHAHRQEHDLFHTNNSNDNNDDSELKDQTDARFLTTWSRLATQQFTQQNLLVALNIELVAERRQLGKRVQKERNATVALRSKIRRVQAETKQVDQELAAIRQQKSTRRAASRFLNAVEQCRK
jgi:hypothetical protein